VTFDDASHVHTESMAVLDEQTGLDIELHVTWRWHHSVSQPPQPKIVEILARILALTGETIRFSAGMARHVRPNDAPDNNNS